MSRDPIICFISAVEALNQKGCHDWCLILHPAPASGLSHSQPTFWVLSDTCCLGGEAPSSKPLLIVVFDKNKLLLSFIYSQGLADLCARGEWSLDSGV